MPPLRLIQDLSEYSALLDRLRLESIASRSTPKPRVFIATATGCISCSSPLGAKPISWIPLRSTAFLALASSWPTPQLNCVFHDADYDLRLLGYEFGFRASNLFDTRIAAQFLNEPAIGLAAMLEKYVGVRPDKRFQRADWSVRPLTQPMLEYAAMDTRHLPVLRDLLRDRLTERGRLDWVEEECALTTAVRWPAPESPEIAALSMKGARALNPRALAVFRELYVWRTRTADSLDRAAFRIVGNEGLIALAERMPTDPSALSGIPGVGRDLIERRETEILDAVRRGLAVPEADLPRFPRAPRHRPDPSFETKLERLKALRVLLVHRLDLQPGAICPNWLLEGVARESPETLEALAQVDGLRRWQIAQFGPELLEAIKSK